MKTEENFLTILNLAKCELRFWKYIWLVIYSDLLGKSHEKKKKKIKLIITAIINFLSSDLLLNTYFYILQYINF